ncbi:unnamed protein product [Rhizophagus irregularis]|uniref:Uncharacterized protein n=1 Tax=Rhizophagus irregularis TaxID=588596 RepID=A0A915ZRZ4_9GLOM|nr:unnamed protein product [Rhizophagus irregularis]
MMIYQTEPSFKLDMSQLGPVFDHNIKSGKLLESSDDYLNIAEEVKQEVARSHYYHNTWNRINFPFEMSATLIKIPNNGIIILLDVGEGTLGSMSRHFGPYDQPHELGDNKDFYSGSNKKGIILVYSLQYCPNSFGISIEHADGWKIVYFGDTRMTNTRWSQDSLAMIEAYFKRYAFNSRGNQNDLTEQAFSKNHSTTEEAVSVGERYPKVPVFTDDHGRVELMQVSIGELYKLPKFIKALKVLYTDENEASIEEDDNVYEEVYIEDEEDEISLLNIKSINVLF